MCAGEAAVAALRTASETPERLWSAGMAAALGEELAHLAGQARAAQVRRHVKNTVLPLGLAWQSRPQCCLMSHHEIHCL